VSELHGSNGLAAKERKNRSKKTMDNDWDVDIWFANQLCSPFPSRDRGDLFLQFNLILKHMNVLIRQIVSSSHKE